MGVEFVEECLESDLSCLRRIEVLVQGLHGLQHVFFVLELTRKVFLCEFFFVQGQFVKVALQIPNVMFRDCVPLLFIKFIFIYLNSYI